MSTTVGDAGAKPAAASTAAKPLGMRKNGMRSPVKPAASHNMLIYFGTTRQTMARAKEGLPAGLRSDIVRETGP